MFLIVGFRGQCPMGILTSGIKPRHELLHSTFRSNGRACLLDMNLRWDLLDLNLRFTSRRWALWIWGSVDGPWRCLVWSGRNVRCNKPLCSLIPEAKIPTCVIVAVVPMYNYLVHVWTTKFIGIWKVKVCWYFLYKTNLDSFRLTRFFAALRHHQLNFVWSAVIQCHLV